MNKRKITNPDEVEAHRHTLQDHVHQGVSLPLDTYMHYAIYPDALVYELSFGIGSIAVAGLQDKGIKERYDSLVEFAIEIQEFDRASNPTRHHR